MSPFSSNVSRRTPLFSVNVGQKRAIFSSQAVYVLKPLQLPGRLQSPAGRPAILNRLAKSGESAFAVRIQDGFAAVFRRQCDGVLILTKLELSGDGYDYLA